ncbi:MAG: hypothetical protein C5B49_14735 [Bdellovibrio sp.]|nr:MAG: hypothetical protein C5B49_14735 [Bdellovibrio sp.]
MNGAHLHLIVNHVSLFALVTGAIALAVSMKTKSNDLRRVATVLFLVAGVFGWVAVETGEEAEEIVKALGGEYESFINEHTLAAAWAQRSGFLVSALAIAMEWAVRKKKNWVKPLQWILLVAALHACTVFGRTAFLGGLIRHTEIRN